MRSQRRRRGPFRLLHFLLLLLPLRVTRSEITQVPQLQRLPRGEQRSAYLSLTNAPPASGGRGGTAVVAYLLHELRESSVRECRLLRPCGRYVREEAWRDKAERERDKGASRHRERERAADKYTYFRHLRRRMLKRNESVMICTRIPPRPYGGVKCGATSSSDLF